MKKIIVFIIILSLAACLFSCGDQSDKTSSETTAETNAKENTTQQKKQVEHAFLSPLASTNILNIDIVFGNVSTVNNKLICIGYVNVSPKAPGYTFKNVVIDYKVKQEDFLIMSNDWDPSSSTYNFNGFIGKIYLDSEGYGQSSLLFVNDGTGTHPLDNHEWTCSITKITGFYITEE
jgi:hypothetical protein